jgi:hypothetical protein
MKNSTRRLQRGASRTAILEVAALTFENRITWASQVLRRPLNYGLTLRSREEYDRMRCFLTNDVQSGFALQPDGELVSVFSIPHGRGDLLVARAVEEGANRLDCYDAGPLVALYQRHGFVETDRMKWDDQYAPNGWIKSHFGTPDVVIMTLDIKPTVDYPE